MTPEEAGLDGLHTIYGDCWIMPEADREPGETAHHECLEVVRGVLAGLELHSFTLTTKSGADAVLTLHKAMKGGRWVAGRRNNDQWCRSCSVAREYVPWPCPTVQLLLRDAP